MSYVILTRENCSSFSNNTFTFNNLSDFLSDVTKVSIMRFSFPLNIYNVKSDTSVTVNGSSGTISAGQYTISQLILDLNAIDGGTPLTKDDKSYLVSYSGAGQLTLSREISLLLGSRTAIDQSGSFTFSNRYQVFPYRHLYIESPELSQNTENEISLINSDENDKNIIGLISLENRGLSEYIDAEVLNLNIIKNKKARISRLNLKFKDSFGNYVSFGDTDWEMLLYIQ